MPGTGIWPICSGCGFYFSREPVEQIRGWEIRERIGTEGKPPEKVVLKRMEGRTENPLETGLRYIKEKE